MTATHSVDRTIPADWLRTFARLPRPDITGVRSAPRHRLTLALDDLVDRSVDQWPAILAEAIGTGDCLRRDYARLCAVLELLHGFGLRVLDSDDAAIAFASLPAYADATVWRGSSEAEFRSRQWGVSWSLDRVHAEGFAFRHDMARYACAVAGRPNVGRELVPDGFDSPSIVLSARVRRSDVSGLLTASGEREVLIHPTRLRRVCVVDDSSSSVLTYGVDDL